MSELSDPDIRWLDAAVRLARPHLGTLGGHPPVAALVVDEDEDRALARVVSGAGGSPTGVTAAVADAGMDAAGRTLYITLEPSLEDARMAVAAGFSRIVVGAHAGGGQVPALLRQHGIPCILAEHTGATELHRPHLHRLRKRRPFTTVRLAVSADGMIGNRDGTPIELLGEGAKDWLGMQRALSDGVLTSARTAELDDPPLAPGLAGLEDRPYARIVVLGSRPLPATLRLMQTTHPVWILCERGKDFGLPPPIEFMTVDSRNGHPDLRQGMAGLAQRNVSALLVEAGAKLSEAMLAAELVDQVHLIETPVEVGRGGLAATPLGGIQGRLRGLGFVEVSNRELGSDRVRTYERVF